MVRVTRLLVGNCSNTETLRAIQEDIRKTVAWAIVTRIAWIHGRKSLEPKKGGRVGTRSSLILYLSKEEEQTQAILKASSLMGSTWQCSSTPHSFKSRSVSSASNGATPRALVEQEQPVDFVQRVITHGNAHVSTRHSERSVKITQETMLPRREGGTLPIG